MTALVIIGVILLIFVLVAFLPIRIRISYSDSIRLFVPLLFWKINIYPKERRLRSMSAKKYRKLIAPKKEIKKSSKSKSTQSSSEVMPKDKLTFSSIKPLIGEIFTHVLALVSKFSNHLNVKVYSLWAVISSEDAATTAITYGAVSSSVSALMGLLHDRCKISYARNAVTGVYVDYTLGECKFDCDIRFTLCVWQILSLVISAAMAFIKTKTKLEENKNVGKQDQ